MRHDGSAFESPMDDDRATTAGAHMHNRFLCFYIKGDLSEYSSTYALPSWSDGLRCCMKCNATLENRFQIGGIRALSCGGFRVNLDQEYEENCKANEILSYLALVCMPLLFRC